MDAHLNESAALETEAVDPSIDLVTPRNRFMTASETDARPDALSAGGHDRGDADAPRPWRDRFLAAGIHLLLSATALGALLAVTLLWWYPDFLFETDGGWTGLRIVVLVDLVLGPLLTFAVFVRGKRGLRFDLSLIAALQIGALLFGAWVLYSERPLALVFNDGRFYSVSRQDYTAAAQPVPDFSGIDTGRPRVLVIDPPEDVFEQSEVRTAYLRRRQPLHSHVPWMVPLAQATGQVLEAGVTRSVLERRDGTALQAWLTEQGAQFEDFAFVPYSGRFGGAYLAVRRDSGAPDGVLDGVLVIDSL